MLRWTIISFALVFNLFAARPFTTDDAPPVEIGDYEFEVGYEFRKGDEGTISLGFIHGLTERMEFGIGIEYLTDNNSGLLSPDISFKYEIIPECISAALSSKFGESTYSLDGIITRIFGPFEIDGNFGYSVEDTTITYGIAVIYKIKEFDLGVEILGDRENLDHWLLGGRYKISKGLFVDFGLWGGVSSKTFKETVGIHYEF